LINLLALTLLLQAPSAEHGVVASRRGDIVSVQLDDGTEQSFDFSQCPVRWHLDPRVTLPPWWLRVGARMKVERRVERANGSIATIDYSVMIVSLGPYASRADDEERYIAAIQALPDAVPTEDQVRRGERVRLERAPRGCDLALGAEEVAVIEALGSRSHLIRECVTKALRERGIASLRTLIWARHARDEEIRTRATSLLRELGWEG
jgi:hypothetical protein